MSRIAERFDKPALGSIFRTVDFGGEAPAADSSLTSPALRVVDVQTGALRSEMVASPPTTNGLSVTYEIAGGQLGHDYLLEISATGGGSGTVFSRNVVCRVPGTVEAR